MGASQGKSKKEHKEEARQWAAIKDNEVTNLYGENTKLTNEMRLLQVDFQAMKQMIEQQRQQQLIIENMSKENADMSRRFEEKLEEQQQQQQLIIENMSKENAVNHEKKSPRRVHFEDEHKEEQGMCCCPTTQEAHDAELQRMFDDEWELILSSHKQVMAQLVSTGGHLDRWDRLNKEGLQAATILKPYGYPQSSIEEMRHQFDVQVKLNKELFKFQGNHFRSVAKVLFGLREVKVTPGFFGLY